MTLLPFLDNVAELPLAASHVSGEVEVENTGTAPASPVWEVIGPCTKFTATSPDGRSFTWIGSLAAGQTLTISEADLTITDSTGANRFDGLQDADSLWMLPPGAGTATLTLEGTDPNSSAASMRWFARNWLVI